MMDESTPEVPVPGQDRADRVVGRILQHADPVDRYRALDLIAGQMTRMRALSAKQLELESGGVGAAADRLGMTRQAVTELYAKADVPGPRRDRQQRDAGEFPPPAALGQWFRRAYTAARLLRREEQFEKMFRHLADGRVLGATMLAAALPEWRRAASRIRPAGPAAAARAALVAAEQPPEVAEWLPGRTRLTMKERGQMIIGFHQH